MTNVRVSSPFSMVTRLFDRFGLVAIAAIAFGLYIVFLALPVLLTFYYSLTNWDGLTPHFDFNWAANFIRAVGDPQVQHAWLVTGAMAIAVVLVSNTVGLGLALLLSRATRANLIYRSLFFYPIVLSSIVVGILWREMLNADGIIPHLLQQLGAPFVDFLGDPVLAVISLTTVIIWQVVAFTMIVYLAGLQTVRKDLVEAARIDGAGARQLFWNVTFPALAPAVTLNTMFMLISTMKEYDHVVAMTGGGPVHASETVAFKLLQDGLTGDEFGYGSAQAVILFLVVVAVSAFVILRLRKREENLT
jgi:ABC-type sugar transport system permease subunit